MSYAPQVPWLQQTSIKNNIICCEPWDAARYRAVLHACALELDLKNMILGDDTPIAEKGISFVRWAEAARGACACGVSTG
jgi:ATP-binding cassette subfamily C (CFTR/MRP) protein 1